ncbi:MFS general substrate transporter [Calocera viscosa TUFC12733]|uniref:MFS general substrate transporter n=1 Tax=Calocera viscosa (strain TUFC12733) TaxID=1330018 RepID=A0A167Q279_CALVF|nr:MFS general substrate transporter [Calocera viscosa TUFC12733]
MDIASMELSDLAQPPALSLGTEAQRSESERELLASELAPVDCGWQAWLFVICAFTLETFIWGFGFCWGVFQNYLTSSPDSPFLGSTQTAISTIGTVSLAFAYLIGFVSIALLKRYPQHVAKILWTSLAVAVGSLILSSFATQIWQLILLQGVVLGTFSGVLYAPALLWVPEWFVAKRSLASGLIFCGSGVGGGLFPVIVGFLLEKTGFRWTLRIWALLFGLFTGLATWFIKPRIPVSRARETRIAPVDWSFFVHPTFIIVAITTLIQALAYFPISLYMPTYTSALGLAPINGQLVLSVFNLFSVVGQIIFGYLCDKISYSRVVMVSGLGAALSAYLVWGFARNLGLIFTFVILFGSLSGGFSSIQPAVAAEVAGANSLSSGVIVGSLGAMKGFAAIIGPIIAGSLYNPADARAPSTYGLFGFGRVTLFVGGMMLATGAGGLASAIFAHLRQSRHSTGPS